MKTYKLIKDIDLDRVIAGRGEIIEETGGFEPTDEMYIGSQSVLIKSAYISKYCPELRELYPREEITLKIFFADIDGEPKLSWRGVLGIEVGKGSNDDSLEEYSKVQSILNVGGLAPTVYRLVIVEDSKRKYGAQITEEVGGNMPSDRQLRKLYDEIDSVCLSKHIEASGDLHRSNVIGGKWVDFQGFRWLDFKKYKDKLTRKFNETAISGNSVNSYQQSVECGLTGGRGSIRLDKFGIQGLDFKGKTVLDIGCSGGYFVNFCAKRGARAVGVDLPDVAAVAREAAVMQGLFNAEYYGYDLNSNPEDFAGYIAAKTGIKKFDYVFFFSMDQHVGYRDYVRQLTGGTLFFESNGGKAPEDEYDIFSSLLDKQYDEVEHLGVTKEGATRNLFICHVA